MATKTAHPGRRADHLRAGRGRAVRPGGPRRHLEAQARPRPAGRHPDHAEGRTANGAGRRRRPSSRRPPASSTSASTASVSRSPRSAPRATTTSSSRSPGQSDATSSTPSSSTAQLRFRLVAAVASGRAARSPPSHVRVPERDGAPRRPSASPARRSRRRTPKASPSASPKGRAGRRPGRRGRQEEGAVLHVAPTSRPHRRRPARRAERPPSAPQPRRQGRPDRRPATPGRTTRAPAGCRSSRVHLPAERADQPVDDDQTSR